MADEPSGQEPANQPGGQEPAGGDGSDNARQADGGSQLTPEQMASELKRARDEAAKYRTQLRDAEGKLQSFETEKLTEGEKLQKRLADAEAKEAAWQLERQELLASSAILEAAKEAKAVNPKAVLRCVDLAAATFGEDGKPTNAAELVAGAKAEYPELFAGGPTNGSADGGARRPAPKGVDMNDWLRGNAALPT